MSARLVSQSLFLERLLVFPNCAKTFFKLFPMSSCEFHNCNTKCCTAFVLDSFLFFLLGIARKLSASLSCDTSPNKAFAFFSPTKHME